MRHDQGGAEEDQQRADAGGFRASATKRTSPDRFEKKQTQNLPLSTNLTGKTNDTSAGTIKESVLSLVRLVEESAAEAQFVPGAAADRGNVHPASDGRS